MAREVIYDRGGVLSTINGLLKDDYVSNQLRNLVNEATYLYTQITAKRTTHGRQFIIPLQFGTSQGVGARGENIQLPDPGFGEFDQALGTVKYLYSTMYITGQSISATQGNRAAFADALKTALRQAKEGLLQDLHRQTWGDGTGALGVVEAAVAGAAVIPVTDPYGLSYVQTDLDDRDKTKLFRRNMNIYISGSDVYTRVTGVNADGTITVASNVTVALGDVIYRGDAAGRTSVNNEITGLSGLLQATGTYLGLPRAGFPEWQSNLLQLGSGAGGALTESAMRIAMDTAEINGTAGPNLIVTDHKTRRRYEALLQSMRRNISPMKLEGGYTAIEFDGLPMMVDKDAPPQRMWFLRTDDIAWYVMDDLQWMDRDGAVLKAVENKDAYRAVMYTYRELVTEAPANQTMIFDITS